MRFHFFVSQPNSLRSRARSYLSELHRATCFKESHSSFFSLFFPAEFLAAATNLCSSSATGPDKIAYAVLKHLSCSGIDFLQHTFNLFWSLHSFPFTWKISSIIFIYKMGKPLDSPASFWPISLTSCVPKLFERTIPLRLLLFLEPSFILFPCEDCSHQEWSTLDQILYLSQSISNGLSNFLALERPLLLSTSLMLPTLSGIPPFSTNLFYLVSLLALLDGLNLFYLIGALRWFFKITKVAPFESVEIYAKIRSWPFTFSLFTNDLPASFLSSVSCSLYADVLANGPFPFHLLLR